MAQQVVIGNETFKRRHPVGVWLGMPLITLFIYYFVWYYKINNEARRYLRDPRSGRASRSSQSPSAPSSSCRHSSPYTAPPSAFGECKPTRRSRTDASRG